MAEADLKNLTIRANPTCWSLGATELGHLNVGALFLLWTHMTQCLSQHCMPGGHVHLKPQPVPEMGI